MFVVTGGRVAGAMLLLARIGVDVEASYDVLLNKTPHLHQRGLAVGVVRVAGERVAVASMHLSLDDIERGRQVDEVLAHMRRLADGAPIVLAGDVNETPDRACWKALASPRWRCAATGRNTTCRARKPTRRRRARRRPSTPCDAIRSHVSLNPSFSLSSLRCLPITITTGLIAA